MHTSLKYLIVAITATLTGLSGLQAQDGYDIRLNIKGSQDTSIILGRYFADMKLAVDTATLESPGKFRFQGDKPLEHGMYILLPQNNVYFEIVIGEDQHFTLESDTVDMVHNMRVKGDADNQAFFDYLFFIQKKQSRKMELQRLLEGPGLSPETESHFKSEMQALDKEVKEYHARLKEEHPNAVITAVANSTHEVDIPEPWPLNERGNPDSLWAHEYYKQHYWDGFDFTDGRLLRSPVYHSKLNAFYSDVLLQVPDTLIRWADWLVAQTRSDSDMFRYTIQYITLESERSKIMGHDAIFVHMVKEYYMKEDLWWVNKELKDKMVKRALMLDKLLIGKRPPEMLLTDTTGNFVTLNQIDAEYTILYFWDTDCGHCRTETPKLLEVYHRLKEHGVEAYAVCITRDHDKWVKYIDENRLDWINVSDGRTWTNFKDLYDIYSTPVIYLLDKDKKIVAKRISHEQLEEILDRKLGLGRAQ